MNNKGTLIVIDGLDGTGKTTQASLVFEHLSTIYKKIKLISFPDYSNRSSELVKLYLSGEIASNPNDVNAYAASSFYAVDRYISYKQHWEHLYNDGYIILATRYTTSNALHQMIKLDPDEWDNYLEWLEDYEYNKLGLPSPDKVILLTMERDTSDLLIQKRYHGDESMKDIHEKDKNYLKNCATSAMYAAQKLDFSVIDCSDPETLNPLPIDTITKKIIKEVTKIL